MSQKSNEIVVEDGMLNIHTLWRTTHRSIEESCIANFRSSMRCPSNHQGCFLLLSSIATLWSTRSIESFSLERNSRMTLLESLLWQQHSFGLFGWNANNEQREKERHLNSNRNFRRHSLFLLLAGEWSSFDCSHHEGVQVKVSVLFRIVLPTVWKFQMASSSSAKNSALRFADLGTVSKRMLAPIEGYEKMPLVSLEEAVKPLVDIVPRVERNVFIIKENCEEPEDGLTSDESAWIMLYTYESMPHEDSLYVILNTTLRSEQRQELTQVVKKRRGRGAPSSRPIGKCHSDQSISDFDRYKSSNLSNLKFSNHKIEVLENFLGYVSRVKFMTHRILKSIGRSDIFRWVDYSAMDIFERIGDTTWRGRNTHRMTGWRSLGFSICGSS